jgi:hypothetical protein
MQAFRLREGFQRLGTFLRPRRLKIGAFGGSTPSLPIIEWSSKEPGRTWLTVLQLIEQVRSARRRLRRMRDSRFPEEIAISLPKPSGAASGGVNE